MVWRILTGVFGIGTLIGGVTFNIWPSFGGPKEFADLPYCEQLKTIDKMDPPVSSHLAENMTVSGLDDFASEIVDKCPQYLVELGRAWDSLSEISNSEELSQFSACVQLYTLENNQQSITSLIDRPDFEAVAHSVVENCPYHLEELGLAWRESNAEIIATPNNLGSIPPEQLPLCQQQNTLGSTSVEPTSSVLAVSDINGIEPDSEIQCPQATEAVPLVPEKTFEEHSHCEQLGIINETPGKSVPEFIYGSGIDDYEFAVRNQCPEYTLALEIAEERTEESQEFEKLSRCEQLNVVSETEGKTVPEFIRVSGIDDYASDIRNRCPQHTDALESAQSQ